MNLARVINVNLFNRLTFTVNWLKVMVTKNERNTRLLNVQFIIKVSYFGRDFRKGPFSRLNKLHFHLKTFPEFRIL